MSDTTAVTTPSGADLSEARDWLVLLKPRVVSLVVFTGAVGLLLAPGQLPPALAFTAVLCIALGAGAAGALNMWWEHDIDALMRRTASRPIPAGRITPGAALGYGVVLGAFSVVTLGLATNLLAAGILALSIFFYVGIYTIWLKRRTAQNIVIGGAAGAFPPIIGWAAVTGDVTLLPILLFAIVFAWTPPHFWALALFAHADYARAGVPMLPVVAGARETRRQVLLYTVGLLPLGLAPWTLGYTGPLYAAVALLVGLGFVRHGLAVWREAQDPTGRSLDNDAAAKRCFRYSLGYLAAIFGALAIDHLVFA